MKDSVLERFDLSGQVAVITGSARGLGRCAAQTLGAAGASLVLFDRLADELELTAAELRSAGVDVQTIAGDVTDDGSLERLVTAAPEPEILVNCVGVQRRQPIEEVSLEDFDWLWRTNARGVFATTRAFVPSFIARRRGKIITIASLGSLIGLDQRVVYSMTKGAVAQMTRSLAVELGPRGVCVNAIAPGFVETAMTREWLHGDQARTAKFLARIPLDRFALPDDLAGTFLFLASSASDYITGQVLVIDGGWTSL